MQLNINNLDGASSGSVDINDSVFGVEFKESLIHQVVSAHLAAGRSGTSAQKNRAAVRGGGAKPWRQKGTGRARAGTIRSPIFRGGGRTFPSSARSYAQKVNRKMYRGAISSILSELIRQGRLRVVESFTIDEPKTKKLVALLKSVQIDDALLVSESNSENLILAARNLHGIDVVNVTEVNPLNLLQHENIVVTSAALKKLEEGLQ